jgi:O-antigen ligase
MSRIESFRGKRARPPLHRAEKRLLMVLGAHLCFLPWALGTMHVWSQFVSLALALAGFALALMPRNHEAEPGWSAGPFRMHMGQRLLRFPVFWIGLALLAYVAVQGFNPSLRYERNETSWWLVRVANIGWLPTSVDAPFSIANPWRQMVIYASAWLVVCSAWVGLTRRRSGRILLGVLAGNAVALGALLAFQRATGDTRLPWPLNALTPRADLTASFVSKNHAGAYLALLTFAAISLATWGYDHGVRTLKKSTPAAVLALMALFLAIAVLFSLSRGASLTLAAMLAVFAVWFYLRRRFRATASDADSRTGISVVLAVLFGSFALYVGRTLDFAPVYNGVDALIQGRSRDESVASRLQARAAGLTLLAERGWRGVGAGGFRHVFPQYVRAYPDIYDGGKLFWEHVHNDWLELPIELGAAGTAIMLAGAVYGVWWFWLRRRLWHSSLVPVLFGCVGTLLHAWIDFPFQCPAILVTWCLLVTLVARGVELEG